MNHAEQLAAHRAWKQLLLTAVVLAILAARVPLLWSEGEFVAEDGWVFFADAWNHPFPGSLLLPYAGYFHLLPRLIAELCSGLPIPHQPYAYAGIGLALNAAILAAFYLPVFRRLVPSDFFRALIGLLLALAPNAQNLGLILGLHWYLAFGLCLVLVTPAPATRMGQILLTIGIMLAVWSSPSSFVLIPFAVTAWWRERDVASRFKLGVMIGSALLVATFAIMMRLDHAERTGAFHAVDLPAALDRLVLRGWLGVGLLGPFARVLPPIVLDVFGLLALVAIIAGIWKYRDRDFALPVATLLAMAVAMILLSLARTAYVAELATLTLPIHTRYLTAPTLLLYLGLGIAGARLLSRTRFLTSVTGLAALLILAVPSQNHWARRVDRFHLRKYVPAIERFSQEKGPASLYIPSEIPYWGPVLEKDGGVVIPPEVGLVQAVGAQADQPGHYTSWLGNFITGPDNWIVHENYGRLQFTGVERGRVFFRDPSDRLVFTSPLLYPNFCQLQGLQNWTLSDAPK